MLPPGVIHEARVNNSAGSSDISVHLTLERAIVRPITFRNNQSSPRDLFWCSYRCLQDEWEREERRVETVLPNGDLTVGATVGHAFGWWEGDMGNDHERAQLPAASNLSNQSGPTFRTIVVAPSESPLVVVME